MFKRGYMKFGPLTDGVKLTAMSICHDLDLLPIVAVELEQRLVFVLFVQLGQGGMLFSETLFKEEFVTRLTCRRVLCGRGSHLRRVERGPGTGGGCVVGVE